MPTKEQHCLSCGKEGTIVSRTSSRTIRYKSTDVTLPELDLPECSYCHDMLLNDSQSDIYSDAIDAAYAATKKEPSLND